MQRIADEEFEITVADADPSEAEMRAGLAAAHAYFEDKDFTPWDASAASVLLDHLDISGVLPCQMVGNDEGNDALVDHWGACFDAVERAIFGGKPELPTGLVLRPVGEKVYLKGDPSERFETLLARYKDVPVPDDLTLIWVRPRSTSNS